MDEHEHGVRSDCIASLSASLQSMTDFAGSRQLYKFYKHQV